MPVYSNSKNSAVDDPKTTNRVMFIVAIVVLVTFIVVMILMSNRGASSLLVPSTVKKVVVELQVKNRGKINLELRNDLMPKTVNIFVAMVNKGYYTGRKFFRVDNYMTMAGSPTDEAGYDNGEPVTLESNPELKVERYSIGMGKDTKANKSSTAIFFIAKAREASFNGKYAVFGNVVDVPSQKVLDTLKLNDTIEKAVVISYDGILQSPKP